MHRFFTFVLFVAGVAGFFLLLQAIYDLDTQTRQMIAASDDTLRDDMEGLQAALRAEFQDEVQKAASPRTSCDAEMIRRASQSVYRLVTADPAGGAVQHGTAWVIDKDKGILATAAHVVSKFGKAAASGETYALTAHPPSDGPPHRVSAVRVHHGYDAFKRDVQDVDPVITVANILPRFIGILPAYDVALVFVDRPEDLADPLPVAPRADLLALTGQLPITSIGYTGTITNIYQNVRTKPLPLSASLVDMDHFLPFGADPEFSHYLTHSAPVYGGASGSPLMTCDGNVVGVVSNIVLQRYVASSGGQRADLISELLDGEDAHVTATRDRHRPHWRKLLTETERVRTAHEALPDYIKFVENIAHEKGVTCDDGTTHCHRAPLSGGTLLYTVHPSIKKGTVSFCTQTVTEERAEEAETPGEQPGILLPSQGDPCEDTQDADGLFVRQRLSADPGTFAMYIYPNVAAFDDQVLLRKCKIGGIDVTDATGTPINLDVMRSFSDRRKRFVTLPMRINRPDLEVNTPIAWVIWHNDSAERRDLDARISFSFDDDRCSSALFDLGLVSFDEIDDGDTGIAAQTRRLWRRTLDWVRSALQE